MIRKKSPGDGFITLRVGSLLEKKITHAFSALDIKWCVGAFWFLYISVVVKRCTRSLTFPPALSPGILPFVRRRFDLLHRPFLTRGGKKNSNGGSVNSASATSAFAARRFCNKAGVLWSSPVAVAAELRLFMALHTSLIHGMETLIGSDSQFEGLGS